MKKALRMGCIIILIIIVSFFVGYFIITIPKYKGEFSVDDFTAVTGNSEFHTNEVYDNIADYQSAAEIGKAAIADRFDNAEGSLLEWKGCDVQYDSSNDVWHIRSYPFSILPMFGGEHNVLLRSDGTVMAIWGEK